MRQPELTSLIGLRDRVGDRLILLRLNRADGTRGYILRVGTGSVFLSAGELEGLSKVIRLELNPANPVRFLARAIWPLILCALVWFFASSVTGPLFAYPWSN